MRIVNVKKDQIERLRYLSRKLVRELGLLQVDPSNSNATPGHWHALIEIAKEPGITISKLGNLLLMSASKISRLIKSLVNDGLIECKSGADKREKYLYITDSGQVQIKKIDDFSEEKIEGAFEFLNEAEMLKIIDSIDKYSSALEKNRLQQDKVKIATISTSRTIRKQIISMITNIQKNEFAIPVTDEINMCVLKAEQEFYYNKSYNFWYAVDDNGRIVGSVGLKKIDEGKGEIKKFFVIEEYRGKGVAQKLLQVLLSAATKHHIHTLFLGTVDKLKAAHKFYDKYGFKCINPKQLPVNFEICPLDSLFFQCDVSDVISKLG